MHKCSSPKGCYVNSINDILSIRFEKAFPISVLPEEDTTSDATTLANTVGRLVIGPEEPQPFALLIVSF